MLWKLNFITIWVSNSITEFWAEGREQKQFVEVITHRSRMTPYPRGADLKNDLRWEGEREYTYKTTSGQSLSN
jgi:hypothetical protein